MLLGDTFGEFGGNIARCESRHLLIIVTFIVVSGHLVSVDELTVMLALLNREQRVVSLKSRIMGWSFRNRERNQTLN